MEAPRQEPIPAAWREFLSRQPRRLGGWTLHDAESAYRITFEDGEFLVLAERAGDEFLLHRIDPPSDVVFYLPSHENNTPEPLEGDFRDIFRKDLINPNL